jgi:hypothetical protein
VCSISGICGKELAKPDGRGELFGLARRLWWRGWAMDR